MMRKILFITLLCISIGINNRLNAQEDAVFGSPDLMPPSPNASSLGQYADIPVSLYTGVPEINIPLFDIKSGNVTLPISLSYHASGIKVEQTASWVGLGWALNAGGVITRSVRGLPDDLYNSTYSGLQTWGLTVNSAGYLYSGHTIENLYNNEITNSNLETVTQIADGGMDSQPDEFYFNFLNYTGTFVFDANGHINLFSKQKLKINYTKTAQGPITAFEVTTEDGTKFTFDKIEQTEAISYTNSNGTGNPCSDIWGSDSNPWPNTINSSWYLSSIKSPENKQITFTYVNDNFQNLTFGGAEHKPSATGGKIISAVMWNTFHGQRLTKIEWESGRVDFISNHSRLDIQPMAITPTVKSMALTEVKVFNFENALVKSYNLNYGYWDALTNCDIGFFDEYKKRLKLISIEEMDINGTGISKPAYNFEYDGTLLPSRFSEKQDFWGYYNGISDDFFPKIYYYANDPITITHPSKYSIYHRWSNNGEQIIQGSNRDPNPAFLQAGILKKIIYPTGGYSSFEYEPNTFYLDYANYTGGGLRIKKIITSDGINFSKDIIKNYIYRDGAINSTGRIIFVPQYARARTNMDFYTDPGSHASIYSASVGGLGSTHGSPIGYTEVTVDLNGIGKIVSKFDLKASFEVSSDGCNGSGQNCMYNQSLTGVLGYDNSWVTSIMSPNPLSNSDQFPFPPDPNYDFNRGNLIEEATYDMSNKLVKKVVNEYTIENYLKIPALSVKRTFYVMRTFEGTVILDADIYKYGKYYYLSAWHHLSKTTEYVYDQGNSNNAILNSKELFYNNPNHMQLTSTKEIDSKGNDITTEFKYPADYIDWGSDDASIAIGKMKGISHIHNVPIEQLKWITINGSKKLISGQLMVFKNFGSWTDPQILQNKIYKLDLSEPLDQALFSPSDVVGLGNFIFDSHYRLLGTYNSYTSSGNLLEMTKEGGISTNYIWSYSNTLPIAQSINAKASESGFTSFESNDNLLWATYPSPQNTLVSEAHSGSFSCKIAAGNIVFGPTRNFLPDNQSGTYIFSCWVKGESGFGTDKGALVMHTTSATDNTAIYPSNVVTGSYKTLTFSAANNGWQYIELKIDLAEIRQNSGILPSDLLQIRIFPYNTDPSKYYLIDDIRFHPANSQMTSYTYKPLVGTTSESDISDQLVTYEYDEFNRLKIIRDNKGKILKKINYHYGN